MFYMLSGGDYEKSALLHVSLGYTVLSILPYNHNCVWLIVYWICNITQRYKYKDGHS